MTTSLWGFVHPSSVDRYDKEVLEDGELLIEVVEPAKEYKQFGLQAGRYSATPYCKQKQIEKSEKHRWISAALGLGLARGVRLGRLWRP